MAFNYVNFGNWGSTMNKRAPQAHLYRSTTDTFATILGSGYFDERARSLIIGDIIYVTASDKVGLIKVTAVSPNVTTAVIDEEGHGLEQFHIYYYGDAGNDTNNGLSMESPFLTPDSAIAAVLAKTPGTNNRFEIRAIGGTVHVGDITVPKFTTYNARSSHIKGQVILSEESKFFFDELTVSNSSIGIRMIANVKAYAEGNLINGGTSSQAINLSLGELRTNIKKIDMTETGSKAWDLSAAAVLFINYATLRENIASTKSGGAVVFENGLDSGSNADTRIYNEVGDLILKGDNVDFSGTNAKFSGGGTEIFTNVGQYPKWTNTPLASTRTSGVISNVTGAGTTYTVVFDDAIVNIGSHYNNTSGVFNFPVTGYYLVCCTLGVEGLTASHDRMLAIFNITLQLRFITEMNPSTVRRNPGVTDDLFVGASHVIKGFNGTGVQIDVSVGGAGSNTVDIQEDSSFDVYLLGAV